MDLRVMSPTSYQTALPRDALIQYNEEQQKQQPLLFHPLAHLSVRWFTQLQ